MSQQLKTCKRKTLDDEFYTQMKDTIRELHKYDLRGRKIICPCDTKESSIYKYLKYCYYNVKCDSKDWRKIDYSKYDIVITNPPFTQIKEFIDYLIKIQIDFIIIVSDVYRYGLRNGSKQLPIPIYQGKDAQHFDRPDGGEVAIHCGWISNIPDDWKENKIINQIH